MKGGKGAGKDVREGSQMVQGHVSLSCDALGDRFPLWEISQNLLMGA